MTDARQELVEAIRAAGGLRTVKVGGKLFVFTPDKEAEVHRQARALAIRTGDWLEVDGERIKWTWHEDVDWSKSGSAVYTWHADGERVKSRLVETRVGRDGVERELVVKTGWHKPEAV